MFYVSSTHAGYPVCMDTIRGPPAPYLSYMGLMSYALFLLTGTIGFLSSLLFVRYIYGCLKVD